VGTKYSTKNPAILAGKQSHLRRRTRRLLEFQSLSSQFQFRYHLSPFQLRYGTWMPFASRRKTYRIPSVSPPFEYS